jgi:SAM-dependent methyltransferase
MSLPACPVCDTPAAQAFFEQRDALVSCNRPAATRDEALAAARADIRLTLCATCSHIYNTAFDADRIRYDAGYENSLYFSATFAAYARTLAEELVQRFDLHGKQIVDIGCGDGAFLRLLCDLGGNRGTGFDPAAPQADGDVELIAAPFSAIRAKVPADFITCRHVLEHLEGPRRFLAELTSLLRSRSASYYFEVPNGLKTFGDGFVWDVLYEHCSHFTPRSLRELFARAGLNAGEPHTAWGEQFLALFGRTATTSSAGEAALEPGDLHEVVRRFARRRVAEVERWRSKLAELTSAGRTVAIWGAGTKGVTFLDAVAAKDTVAAVVDVNPRKHGKWLAGCGLQVMPPAALSVIRPHTVVVMNPIYLKEVRAALNGLGLNPETVPVADP